MPPTRSRSISPAPAPSSIWAIRRSNNRSAASARSGDASGPSRSGCGVGLSAFRSIEKHPDREVVGKVLEAVYDACLREEHVVRSEPMPSSAVDEPAFASRNDVNLVAHMRRLRIVAARSVELDLQRAVLEHRRGPLSIRSRQKLYRLRQRDPANLRGIGVPGQLSHR